MWWAAPYAKVSSFMNGPSEAAHLLRMARKDLQAMRALSDPEVAAIGVECLRERSTGQPPPDKRLHVWRAQF